MSSGSLAVHSVCEFHEQTNVEPLAEPHVVTESLERKLSSNKWSDLCEGLLQFRALVVHHTDEVGERELTKWMPLLLVSLANLRSAVVKAALLCVIDILNTRQLSVAPFISAEKSSLFHALLEKSSFEKKFVMSDARRALYLLVDTAPSEVIITSALLLVKHSRPQFRAQVAFSIAIAVEKSGAHGLQNIVTTNEGLIEAIFTLANDAHQSTRQEGRRAANTVREKFLESHTHAQWQQLLREHLNVTLLVLTAKWHENVSIQERTQWKRSDFP